MIWMRLAPYILAAAALLGALGYVAYLRHDNASLRAENVSMARELKVAADVAEQAKLARQIADAHRQREAQRAAELQRGMEALLTGDFANADTPIDPRIADFLECMRRNPSGNADDCAGGLGGLAPAGPDQ